MSLGNIDRRWLILLCNLSALDIILMRSCPRIFNKILLRTINKQLKHPIIEQQVANHHINVQLNIKSL